VKYTVTSELFYKCANDGVDRSTASRADDPGVECASVPGTARQAPGHGGRGPMELMLPGA
jgi:hypothetical protein